MAPNSKQTPSAGSGYTLDAAVDTLLQNPDIVAQRLLTADSYMQAYAQNRSAFILPKEHAFLKPVIDAYAFNLEGFVHFIVGIRDSLPKDSVGWERTQDMYRRLSVRHLQQIRRERSDRAIKKAESLYGETTFHTRLKWVADLEHAWAKRRLEYLADRREKTANGRLSSDERAEALSEFWDIIDTEINNGEVPPWS